MSNNFIKTIDYSRLSNELDHLSRAKTTFEAGIQKLMSYDLPISIKWLEEIQNGEDLKEFLFNAMNKSFRGYVPASTKARLKSEYFDVAEACSNDVSYCSSVVRGGSYVIREGKGLLFFDEEASIKQIESRCYIFLDADKIAKGAESLLKLEKALREFKEETVANGFSSPDGGLTFYNDYGGCGLVDWHWLTDTLRSKPNLTQEEAEELSKKLYRFECVVKKDVNDEA